MRLSITHTTTYRYERPLPYGLQQVRKDPYDGPGQRIDALQLSLGGAVEQAAYADHHGNSVRLVRLENGQREVTLSCAGVVETEDAGGLVGPHRGHAPLWLYLRPTSLTRPGGGVRALLRRLGTGSAEDVGRLHALSALVLETLPYQIGETHATTAAEEALLQGFGVCQDHAHVFIAAARAGGWPARYISGYLFTEDNALQEAAHAWAEVHVEGLGWVGFDISNGISPDPRYVRVACGLDYADCAPVSGLRFGSGEEMLDVTLRIEQQ